MTGDNGGMSSRPLRIAIVGAGPSGLFAAQALLSLDETAQVHLIDRMPTPFGLLRYGVAPDHASIKAIASALGKVLESDRIHFRGMVEFGVDVTREELLASHDAVIYAAGAGDDQRMGLPGEELPGSRSARRFVDWYSGHPDALAFRLDGVTQAVVVGNGNVALDCARMLLKTREALLPTDIPDAVLATLHDLRLSDLWIVGRRGAAQAPFTSNELRELVTLPGLAVEVSPGAFDGVEGLELDRRQQRNIEILQTAAANRPGNPQATLHFQFWAAGTEVLGEDAVTGMRFERTTPSQHAGCQGTGETFDLPCQLVLRSIGYRGRPLPGVPFDQQSATIPNVAGRVIDEQGALLPGEYCVGWIKRGPRGVIGTNKPDAVETVRHLLADVADAPLKDSRPDLDEQLAARGVTATNLDGWHQIDRAERLRGEERGSARTKIERWAELANLACRGPQLEPED